MESGKPRELQALAFLQSTSTYKRYAINGWQSESASSYSVTGMPLLNCLALNARTRVDSFGRRLCKVCENPIDWMGSTEYCENCGNRQISNLAFRGRATGQGGPPVGGAGGAGTIKQEGGADTIKQEGGATWSNQERSERSETKHRKHYIKKEKDYIKKERD